MTMHRLILLLAFQLAFAAQSFAADQRPNIVFIFADDWGWGDLSCHGSKHVQTPNIDRLVSQGTDFQQFDGSNPVCSPSRTAAMTGNYPARYCVHQHFAEHELNRERGMPDWLDPKATMLPRLLQQAGYRTGHFGKWHLTNSTIADAPLTTAYGFDESAVFNGPPPNTRPHLMINEVVNFITANKDHPFYVNVWLHETHTPHYPSEKLLAAQHGDEQHRVYAAVVAEGDRKVGRVLDCLHKNGLDDNTLVIFSSDNGPEWTGPETLKKQNDGLGTYYSVGETGGRRGSKRSLFEGGVHLPFVVRWPGHTPAGAKDETTLLAAVDLLPTLCAAAHVALPADYKPDGENMLPALEGHATTRSKPLYWEWKGNSREPDWWPRLAVREGDWKLLIGADEHRAELYNLAKDPGEQHDLANDESERVAKLSKMAFEWRSTLPAAPPKDCISTQPPRPRIK